MQRRAGDVEAQRVAEREAERLRQALLDAQRHRLRPARPADELVVRRHRRRVAQVELAVDEAPGAVLGKVVGLHRRPLIATRRPRIIGYQSNDVTPAP